MAKLVTLIGGSGFVGRAIAAAAGEAGWTVRVAVRHPEKAADMGVEAVACDIRKDDDVTAALAGAEAVVNCVGILAEGGGATFEALQAEGAARVARLAAKAGLSTMVQLSAIGADASSASAYARTKAAGEEAVLRHMPGAMILRPSIVFGPGDSFFNRFADMTKISPFVPVVGAGTRFQPVFVEDVAKAVVAGLGGAGGIHEVGGPQVETFQELMDRMLGVLGRRRLVLPLPVPVGQLMGLGFETLSAVSGGRIAPQITRDQVKNLAKDNVVSGSYQGFDDLGITPTPMDEVLPTYLS
ncbi:MAG: NAD-dependent epimerase/dehydratase family protein [Pseudomonadota bacterium]